MLGIHCDNCPNKGRDMCKFLYNKIDCFQEYLYDKEIISVSNGSSRMAINDAIYNILRQFSTDKEIREGDDANTTKPCDVVKQIIQK